MILAPELNLTKNKISDIEFECASLLNHFSNWSDKLALFIDQGSRVPEALRCLYVENPSNKSQMGIRIPGS